MLIKLLNFLAWIGFVRRKSDGKWRWPFHMPPRHWFKTYNGRIAAHWRANGKATKWRPYVFRNKGCDPWFHNRRGHKRLLPFRWGIGWVGFEFGDRGGEHVPVVRDINFDPTRSIVPYPPAMCPSCLFMCHPELSFCPKCGEDLYPLDMDDSCPYGGPNCDSAFDGNNCDQCNKDIRGNNE